jgi:nitrous oxide reductase
MTDKDDSRFNEDADDNASKERLSRRSFLVATAALGAAAEMDTGSAVLAQSGSNGHANALIRRGTGAL